MNANPIPIPRTSIAPDSQATRQSPARRSADERLAMDAIVAIEVGRCAKLDGQRHPG
jgi:hypothetical protein